MELRDGDLVLRPWTEDDVDAIVAGCNDPEIARWIPTIPHPYTESRRARVHPRRGAARAAGVWRSSSTGASSAASGSASNSHDYRATHRVLGGGLVRAVRASARGRCDCSRGTRSRSSSSSASISITDPDNVASQRVAEKVGFQREGVLRAHLRHPDGRIRDSVMFSLLPGELRE